MRNSFGHLYRLTSFGESHGKTIGGVIDGCPANTKLDLDKIQQQLQRRKPGQSKISTPRKEDDLVDFLSGLQENKTLGTPIGFLVQNNNIKPKDYAAINQAFRPSHADYTVQQKYQISATSGGGRLSARETISRVVAGSIAEQVIQSQYPQTQIVAYVESVHQITAEQALKAKKTTRTEVDQSLVRCPDTLASTKMLKLIEESAKNGDSLGGTIRCFVYNPPVGLGEPVFDKLQATLSHALMSIPACKGFEIGGGFESSRLYGSENNDAFYKDENNRTRTKTNYSGGIQGGISNGEPIEIRLAFKPPSSILKQQQTLTKDGVATTLSIGGRHDPCVLPRAVPIVESMVAMTLLDAILLQQSVHLS